MSKASCICGSPHGQHYADCPVLLRSEITGLRNELHLAQEWSARVIDGQEQDITEITRLRAEVEKLCKSRNRWGQKYNKLLGKHKATRTELANQIQWVKDLADDLIAEEAKTAALRAKVERLEGALRWIDEPGSSLAEVINHARAALGDTHE